MAPARIAAMTPRDWSTGSVGTLAITTEPAVPFPASSSATRSVNVPPTSMPTVRDVAPRAASHAAPSAPRSARESDVSGSSGRVTGDACGKERL